MLRRLFSITILVWLLVPFQTIAEPVLSDEDIATLESGDVFVESQSKKSKDGINSGSVKAAIDINAPPEVVWKIMVDCANAPNIVPKLKKCEVLESSTNENGQVTSDTRLHVFSLSRLWPKTKNEFSSDYIYPQSIVFKRIGGDLKVMEGRWIFIGIDEGRKTRLFYESKLATNIPVPRFMINRALFKDTPKILKNVRKASEQVAAIQSISISE